MGLFTRPPRQLLPTVGSRRYVREVFSEAELNEAINDAGRRYAGAEAGLRIVLAAPFTIESTVTIPATVTGLTIESNAFMPMAVAAALDPLFDVQGYPFRLNDFFADVIDGGTLTKFMSAGPAHAGSTQETEPVIVERCRVSDATAFFAADTSAGEILTILRDNMGNLGTIVVHGDNSLVDNNIHHGSTSTITVDGAITDVRVVHNHGYTITNTGGTNADNTT